MKEGTRIDMDAYLAKFDPPVRELAWAVRRVILETEPEFDEVIKWRAPVYVKNGNVLAIVAHKSHVNLEFFRGVELPDSEGMLEGTGKKGRHVKVRKPDDVQLDAVAVLIREAVALEEA